MLNQHSTTTTNQSALESAVLDNLQQLDDVTKLDFKLTTKAMRNVYGAAKTDVLPYIEKHMLDYGIDNKKRMSVFLAACFVMSGGFRRGAEKLNVSACRLLKEHPDKVSNMKMAKKVVQCGEREIANLIYSFTKGNGGIDSDDGWHFRARTPLQVRGRDIYTVIAKRTGIDCVNHPELLDILENGVIAAMAIWEHLNYNKVVDKIKFANTYELDVKVNNSGIKNYRTNSGAVTMRKRLDGTTSSLVDFCNFIEMSMLYL